jgi:hypothetical protein
MKTILEEIVERNIAIEAFESVCSILAKVQPETDYALKRPLAIDKEEYARIRDYLREQGVIRRVAKKDLLNYESYKLFNALRLAEARLDTPIFDSNGGLLPCRQRYRSSESNGGLSSCR